MHACKQDDQKNNGNAYSQKIIESNGYAVPADSIQPARQLTLEERPFGDLPDKKPGLALLDTLEYPCSAPVVTELEQPMVAQPGTDTFSLPAEVTVIDSPFLAKAPKLILAKDPAVKENNRGNFTYFGKKQGLKSGLITSLLEDSFGNIWIGYGGNGITRYDGKNFAHYGEEQGITSGSIARLLQDNKGNLWFGTEWGATKFDGKKFTDYRAKQGLTDKSILGIVMDSKKNIWLASWGDGLYCYNGKTFKHYTQEEGLRHNGITSMAIDSHDNIWLAHIGGLTRFDGKTFFNYPGSEQIIAQSSIAIDKQDNVWFCNKMKLQKISGNKIYTYTLPHLSNTWLMVKYIDEDGAVWLGADAFGIIKFDGKTFSVYSEKQGLPNPRVLAALQDRHGAMWFGTEGGVARFGGNLFTHLTKADGLSSNAVKDILQDKNGKVWLATQIGVNCISGNTVTIVANEHGLKNQLTSGLAQDQQGNIWIASEGSGWYMYNGKKYRQVFAGGGALWATMVDSKNNVWCAMPDAAVTKFDGKIFTRIGVEQGLCNGIASTLLEDKAGNIWIGTRDGGVSLLSGTKWTTFNSTNGLSNNHIIDMIQDKDGNILFATEKGISVYDGKKFRYITKTDGLADDVVTSVFQDSKQNYWFGTPQGLCYMSKQNFKALMYPKNKLRNTATVYMKTYTYEDGLQGMGCNAHAVYELSNGEIWFGTNEGITIYHPNAKMTDTLAPNMQITGLGMYNDDIDWAALKNTPDTLLQLSNGINISHYRFTDVSKWYGLPKDLSLAYDNNFICLTYIGITSERSNKIKYTYILEGLDANWSALTTQTQAHYGNLPHGTFTFRVKARNSDGYWSKEAAYTFTIRPPWWKTIWFRSLAVCGLLFGLYLIFRWRTAKLRKRQHELELTVEERTLEVVTQKMEIEQKHKEITDSIHYAKRIQNALLPSEKYIKRHLDKDSK